MVIGLYMRVYATIRIVYGRGVNPYSMPIVAIMRVFYTMRKTRVLRIVVFPNSSLGA